MQIVTLGDSLHEVSNPVFLGKIRKNVPKYLLKFLPSLLNVKYKMDQFNF